MSCVVCEQWNGTVENHNCCSSCFRQKYPEESQRRNELSKQRLQPLEQWRSEWKNAWEDKDIAALSALVDRANLATQSDSGDGNDDLCLRHVRQLENIFEETWTHALRPGALDKVSALLEAKTPPKPNATVLLKMLLPRSANIPIFDLLVTHPVFREGVNTQLLVDAMYVSTEPVHRPPWVERLLAPEFQDSVQVTASVVKQAKYLSSSTNGGSNPLTRQIQSAVNAAAKDRTQRMAAERKTESAAATSYDETQSGGAKKEAKSVAKRGAQLLALGDSLVPASSTTQIVARVTRSKKKLV